MNPPRSKKKSSPPDSSNAEQRLADAAHRQGVPTFLLRLRRDVGASVSAAAAWRPTHRHD